MNKRLWDIIDLAILITPIVIADVYAWYIHQAGWGFFFLGFGLWLGICEIISKIKSGKTLTQNMKRLWREERGKALILLGSISFFFIYLILHLTVIK